MYDKMMLLRVISLVLAIWTTDALDCYTCSAVHLADCHNTILCPAYHECSTRTSNTGGNTIYILACTPKQDCQGIVNSTSTQFVGRAAVSRDQDCNECCSTDGCNKRLCSPVDGGWSSWSDWNVCDVTCGNGSESRSRKCDSPGPRNGGQQCAGSSMESRPCSRDVCPVDGGWEPWLHWNHCSVSCGSGVKHRTRTCSNPYPDHRGHYCSDTPVEYQTCAMGPCAPEPQVIFSANNPTRQIYTGASVDTTHGSPIFQTIEVNIGGAYNPSTGLFTAPVHGVYEFNAVLSNTNQQFSTSCKLLQNGQEKMFIANTSQGAASSSMFTYLTLARGDRVQLDCLGWSHVYTSSSTSFHGALKMWIKN